jgi:hypothetical protein
MSVSPWFATHPTRGLGVADPDAASSLLRVFKPFFVSPRLPFSATRGEDLVGRSRLTLSNPR